MPAVLAPTALHALFARSGGGEDDDFIRQAVALCAGEWLVQGRKRETQCVASRRNSAVNLGEDAKRRPVSSPRTYRHIVYEHEIALHGSAFVLVLEAKLELDENQNSTLRPLIDRAEMDF